MLFHSQTLVERSGFRSFISSFMFTRSNAQLRSKFATTANFPRSIALASAACIASPAGDPLFSIKVWTSILRNVYFHPFSCFSTLSSLFWWWKILSNVNKAWKIAKNLDQPANASCSMLLLVKISNNCLSLFGWNTRFIFSPILRSRISLLHHSVYL